MDRVELYPIPFPINYRATFKKISLGTKYILQYVDMSMSRYIVTICGNSLYIKVNTKKLSIKTYNIIT